MSEGGLRWTGPIGPHLWCYKRLEVGHWSVAQSEWYRKVWSAFLHRFSGIRCFNSSSTIISRAESHLAKQGWGWSKVTSKGRFNGHAKNSLKSEQKIGCIWYNYWALRKLFPFIPFWSPPCTVLLWTNRAIRILQPRELENSVFENSCGHRSIILSWAWDDSIVEIVLLLPIRLISFP